MAKEVTVRSLVEFAIERGEAYESAGAGKASRQDLTHYVVEIYDEMAREGCEIPAGVVGAALAQIWDE